jgi:hypothetical protein
MGSIDPGDSTDRLTTDQDERYNRMCRSNRQYDELTVQQYRGMESAKRMGLPTQDGRP